MQSVDWLLLGENGYAFTLTLKTCPESPEQWQRLVKNYLESLRKVGFNYLHWVVEWQRRGVPHLHGVVYFTDACDPLGGFLNDDYCRLIICNWVRMFTFREARVQAQDCKPISDAKGWFKYLAKHAGR
ncbi:helitron helicase-like domain-containing protein, partial [Candidatus Izimaplasma sp. ZiA1]|uniref:helitron helicase-like domain-containing protein n=1 Tax=Candidatus Izimoplasma sp. ZiA1 TaxID=2024899 RepID=UPI001F0A64D6